MKTFRIILAAINGEPVTPENLTEALLNKDRPTNLTLILEAEDR